MYTTKKTLLKRLQKLDNIAWEEFYHIYWPLVLTIGGRLGMTPDVCKDLMQEIMINLFRGEALLRYDASRGRFRTFFSVLVRHKAAEILQASARFASVSGAAAVSSGDGPAPAPMPLRDGGEENDPFQEMFDKEYRKCFLSVAMNELRNSVNPKTYAIFELVILQGRPARDVAKRLGISRASIDVSCSRCRKALRRIVADIRAEDPEFSLDIPL